MTIKVFCDIADLNNIKKFNNNNFVKGFTTNPSLMRKAGAKDYKSYSKQILRVCNRKPISFEVFADNPKLMIEQGIKINNWGKNIYVKVPVDDNIAWIPIDTANTDYQAIQEWVKAGNTIEEAD